MVCFTKVEKLKIVCLVTYLNDVKDRNFLFVGVLLCLGIFKKICWRMWKSWFALLTRVKMTNHKRTTSLFVYTVKKKDNQDAHILFIL